MLTKKSSVLIASFSPHKDGKRLPTNGNVEPLVSFFVPKTKKTVLIDETYPGSDTVMPFIEVYENGELVKITYSSKLLSYMLYPFLARVNYEGTHIPFKIRDFLCVLDYAVRQNDRFDYFVGLDSINAIAGMFLKKIGKVKKVIYYVSDYSPTRYGNTFFNKLYLWLDRFCVKHADCTWDVSPAIKEGRIEAGLSVQDTNRILQVPNGVFKDHIISLPINKRKNDAIVYMGALDIGKGVDLVVKALALVHKRRPQVMLHVVGGTKAQIDKLRQFANSLGVDKSIVFYGFIPPGKDMADIIKQCYIGLSTYKESRDSANKYGDAGKIRQYMACGLPVVTTTVQWYAKHIIGEGAGVEADGSAQSFANAILTFLYDENLYKRCSQKAIDLSKNNTWENSYTRAFAEMERAFRY